MSTKLSKNNNQTKKPLNKKYRNKLSLPLLEINSSNLDDHSNNKKNTITLKTRVLSSDKEEHKLTENTNIKNPLRFSQAQPYKLPLISPRERTENSTQNNLDKIIDEYNKIKITINEFNETSKNNLNNTKSIQEKNTILLKYVNKLNNILEFILSSNKNKNNSRKYLSTELSAAANYEVKENNNKLLKSYITQYNMIYNKYQKYSNENFLNELREKIKNYSEAIIDLEKKNRQLQTLQQKSEYAFKKNFSNQNIDSEIKFKSDELKVLTKELNQLIEKSSKNQEKINDNENQINKLIKKEQTLITIATDIYEIKDPEKKIEIKKNEEVDNDLYIKMEEIEKTVQIKRISVKKSREKFSNNKKNIKELELRKNYKRNEHFEKTNKLYLLNEYLNDLQKKTEIDKNNAEKNKNKKRQSVPSKSVDKLNDTQPDKIESPNLLIKSTAENKNINFDRNNNILNIYNYNYKSEINSPCNDEKIIKSYTDKRKEYVNSNINIENVNDLDLSKKNSSKKQLDKEMVLKNLEEQNVKEQNYGQSRLINNPNSSITINRTKLKPNFSFTLGGIVNKISNIKINKSVALIPNNSQNEFSDEIKEDILIDNNDSIVNIKNSKTLDKENKRNILTKSTEIIQRENALNTILYNQLDKEENIENNENNENKGDLSSFDANDQEQVFTAGKSLKKINGKEVKVEKGNEKEEMITINNKKENDNIFEGIVLDVNIDKENEKNIKDNKENDAVPDEIIEEYEI